MGGLGVVGGVEGVGGLGAVGQGVEGVGGLGVVGWVSKGIEILLHYLLEEGTPVNKMKHFYIFIIYSIIVILSELFSLRNKSFLFFC